MTLVLALSRRSTNASLAALLLALGALTGCTVVASNPLDPGAPADLQARTTIRVKLTGADDGQALSGAVLTLEGPRGVTKGPTPTSEAGTAEFDDLAPGHWAVKATHATHLAQLRDVTLLPGEAVDLAIALEPLPARDSELSGHVAGVVQRSGELARPVEEQDHSGILVEVEGTGARALTGRDGSFDLLLLGGTYNLVFTTRQYNLARRNGVVVKAGLTTTLPESPVVLDGNPGTVVGTVELEGVAAGGNHGDVLVSLQGAQSGPSAADGTYRLTGVAAGTYALSASKPGFDTVTLTGIAIEGGRTTTVPPVRLAISRGGITGRFQLAGRTDHSGIAVSVSGTSVTAATNEQGLFAIERLPVGTYELVARREGYARTVVGGVPVASGATKDIGSATLAVLQGDFEIDGGARFTRSQAVSLALAFDQATQMRVSEDATFATAALGDTAFRTFEAAPAFTLSPGDGTKTVYAQFLLADGTTSDLLSGSITLDTAPPEAAEPVIDRGALYTTDPAGRVNLQLSATDATSGVVEMQLSNDLVFDEPWVPFALTNVHVVDDPASDGVKTIYARFRDAAGNETPAAVSASIGLDRTPPELGSFRIDCDGREGPASCRASLATLAIDATGADRMILANQAGFPGAAREPFAASRTWFLAAGDGARTVYLQLFDAAGNASLVTSASVTVDSVAPQSPSVSVLGGPDLRLRAWPLALSAIGADELRIDWIAPNGTRTEGTWEPYATSATLTIPATAADGSYRIEARFRDAAGNESSLAYTSANLDTLGPTNVSVRFAAGAYTASARASLSLFAIGATEVAIATDDHVDTEPWQPYVDALDVTLPSGDGLKTVAVLFRDAAGNVSAELLASTTLDTALPSGNLQINAGAAATASPNVVLTFPSASADATQLQVSEQSSFTDAAWQTFQSRLLWALSSGDGTKTLYARFRDDAGNVGAAATASITLDSKAPTSPSVSITEGLWLQTLTAHLTLAATGASEMRVDLIDAAGVKATGMWETYATSKTVTLPGTAQGFRAVEATFRDAAGNLSATASAQATYDSIAPSDPSLVFTSPWTTTTTVTATLDALGASQLVVATDGVIDAEPWEAFTRSRTIVLSPGDGTKTVAARFRDEAGNLSTVVMASIVLDTTLPSGSMSINAGASRTTQSLVSLAFSSVSADVTEMQVSNDSAFSGATWQAYVSALAWSLTPSDGAKTVYARFRDAAGNTSSAASASITLDTAPPTSPTITVSNGAYVATRSVSLALSSIGADEMRIDATASDGATATTGWVTYATTHLFTLPGASDGLVRLEATFRDLAGNRSSIASAQTLVDTVAPSAPTLSLGALGYTTATTVTAALDALGASQMVVAADGTIDSEPWETFARTKSLVLSAGDGTKTVAARFRDEAGNLSAIVTATIVLDTALPLGSLAINGGATRTTQSLVSLAFSTVSADVTEMQVSNDSGFSGATWQAYVPSLAWSLTASDGAKTVYARFRDAAGNTSTSVSANITLDTVAPTSPSISVTTGAYVPSRAVSLALSAVGADEMRIDATAADGTTSTTDWVAYATTRAYTLPGASDGLVRLEATFRDLAGNRSSIASAQTLVDTVAPGAPTLSLGSLGYTTTTTVTAALDALGASQMAVAADGTIDSEPWETFARTKSLVLSAGDGTKTVAARFRDEAGNLSAIVTATIVLDTALPSGSLSINGGATRTTQSLVSLAFSAVSADVTEMQVSNDSGLSGATWQAYVPSLAWSLTSSDGAKTVYARFRDAAGNTSTSVSANITLDTVGPSSPTISVPAGAYVSSRTVSLSLSAVGADEMRITVTAPDGTATNSGWISYATSRVASLTGVADGIVRFDVVYRDFAGNLSAVASTQTVLDTVEPSDGDLTLPGAHTKTPSITVSLVAVGATEMRISVDGGFDAEAWEPYTTTQTVVLPSGDGLKTVAVQFRDAAGNLSASAEKTITLDTTAPAGSITLASGAATTTSSYLKADLVTADNDVSEMMLSTDPAFAGASWQPYSDTTALVASSSDGAKTVYAKLKDVAGNVSDIFSDSITLDTTGPTGVDASINSGATYTSSAAVTLTLVGGDATQMRISNRFDFATGSGWINFATTRAWTLDTTFGDGAADVFVQYRDAIGNLSAIAVASIGLDLTKPTITSMVANAKGFSTTNSMTAALAATDNYSGVTHMQFSRSQVLGSGTWEAYSQTKLWSIFATAPATTASGTVYVWVRDAAGNVSSVATQAVVVDMDVPTISSFRSFPATLSRDTGLSLTLTAADTSPGEVREMIISESPAFTGAAWETYAAERFYVLSAVNGTKTLYAKVRDAAGRESVASSLSLTLDTAAPTIESISVVSGTSTVSSDGYANGSNVNVRLTVQDNLTSGTSFQYAVGTRLIDCTSATYAAATGSTCTDTRCTEDLPLTLGSLNTTYAIYACVKDEAGNVSLLGRSSVYRDTVAPSLVSGIAITPYSRQMLVSWRDAVDGESGVRNYKVEYTTAGNFVGAPSVMVSGTSAMIDTLVNRIPYNVQVTAFDKAGNQGPAAPSVSDVLGLGSGKSALPFGTRGAQAQRSVLANGWLYVAYAKDTGTVSGGVTSVQLARCNTLRDDCRLSTSWSVSTSAAPLDPLPVVLTGGVYAQRNFGIMNGIPIEVAYDRLWIALNESSYAIANPPIVDTAAIYSCDFRQTDCINSANWTRTELESNVRGISTALPQGPLALKFTGTHLVMTYVKNYALNDDRLVVASCPKSRDCTVASSWNKPMITSGGRTFSWAGSAIGLAGDASRLWIAYRTLDTATSTYQAGVATCDWTTACDASGDFSAYPVAAANGSTYTDLARLGSTLYLTARSGSAVSGQSVLAARCDTSTLCDAAGDWIAGPTSNGAGSSPFINEPSGGNVLYTLAAEGTKRLHVAYFTETNAALYYGSCEAALDCTNGSNWVRFPVDREAALTTWPSLQLLGSQPVMTYMDSNNYFRYSGPRVMAPYQTGFSGGTGSITGAWSSLAFSDGYDVQYRSTTPGADWEVVPISDPLVERAKITTATVEDFEARMRSSRNGEVSENTPPFTTRPFYASTLNSTSVNSFTNCDGSGDCANYASAANSTRMFVAIRYNANSYVTVVSCDTALGTGACRNSANWKSVDLTSLPGNELNIAATDDFVYVTGRDGGNNVHFSRCNLRNSSCSFAADYTSPTMTAVASQYATQLVATSDRAWIVGSSAYWTGTTYYFEPRTTMLLNTLSPTVGSNWVTTFGSTSVSENTQNGYAAAANASGLTIIMPTTTGIQRGYCANSSGCSSSANFTWSTIYSSALSLLNTSRAIVDSSGTVSFTAVHSNRLWIASCRLGATACANPWAWSWVPLADWGSQSATYGQGVDLAERNGITYVSWTNFDATYLAACRSDCWMRENWSVAPLMRQLNGYEPRLARPNLSVLANDTIFTAWVAGTGTNANGLGIATDGKMLPPTR